MSTRVYAPRGRVAHLLPDSTTFYAGRVGYVLCGLWAWHRSYWLGTGSQDEYERADALPLCKNCERRAAS